MMNTLALLFCGTLLWTPGIIYCQLAAEELASAVRQDQCNVIKDALDSAVLIGEQMKFHGAVCHYRNGDLVSALSLFQEVSQMKGNLWHFATFWEAKIYALQGREILSMERLLSLPEGVLNNKMLSQPVFDKLAQDNEAFKELKQSRAPGFNLWTGILAVIAILGLMTSILLFFGKSRFSRGEKWLAAVVFAFTAILVCYLLIWTKYVISFPYLQSTWPFLTLLVGPSLYFYLKATFKEDVTTNQILLHYAIPFGSFILTLPAILGDFGIASSLSPDFRIIGSSATLLTGQLLFYAVRISSITHNEWQVDTNIRTWTRAVALGMWLYTLAFLSYFVLVACAFFNPEWDYAVSLMMALGIIGITYMGVIQKRIFSSEPIETFLPAQKYQSSSLTSGASESIKMKLERLLKEDQVFKENELRLDDLAAYLEISRHQLSQVINEHYKVNFFEFINRYRIEYVKRVLANPESDKLTIIQIAYEAGFNNKASFNRYFKQETGLTPSAYRIKEHSAL